MLPGQLTAGGQSDGVLRSWGAGEKGPMPRVKNNSLQRLFLDGLAEGSRTHSNGQTTAREWHSLRLLVQVRAVSITGRMASLQKAEPQLRPPDRFLGVCLPENFAAGNQLSVLFYSGERHPAFGASS